MLDGVPRHRHALQHAATHGNDEVSGLQHTTTHVATYCNTLVTQGTDMLARTACARAPNTHNVHTTHAHSTHAWHTRMAHAHGTQAWQARATRHVTPANVWLHTLQHTATHCIASAHAPNTHAHTLYMQHTHMAHTHGTHTWHTRMAHTHGTHAAAGYYIVLQCVAVCCSVLQRVAVCIVLQ